MNAVISAASLWAARHERRLVLAGLFFIVVAGLWATLVTGDWLMQPAAPATGTLSYIVLLFIMWWTMMMAMMLPTAAPAILSYGTIARKVENAGPITMFVMGYAAIWTAFSATAVALQILTTAIIPLNGMMAVISRTVGAGLLIGAGLYQFSPMKRACLRHCQSPFFYLAHHWQNGTAGAWRMGLAHGIYCTGCCWVLMLLLFYGGVMELTWIVGLALFVAAEKLIPAKFHVDKLAGTALIAWGLSVLWQTFG